MITMIDYGVGNVLAFQNVYKRLNVPVAIAKQADDLRHATKLILPGVGAFDHAMDLLNRSGMRDEITDLVTRRKVPLLGICVGMQMLARSSEEGRLPGLGWLDACVRRFPADTRVPPLAVPHMGWNDVRLAKQSPLFTKLETDGRFYFLHSYFVECRRPEDVLAFSTYGSEFGCAVASGNIYGVQFHPEKSHSFGTRLLKNFADL